MKMVAKVLPFGCIHFVLSLRQCTGAKIKAAKGLGYLCQVHAGRMRATNGNE